MSGFFELRNHELLELDKMDPNIVFRFETFSAGNDYVDEAGGSDSNWVLLIYAAALSSWLDHLKYGATNFYSDEYGDVDSTPALL